MTGQKDDNVAIWRYMSFTKFVSILAEDHKLFFARPFKFDDAWEGKFPPSYSRNLEKYARKHHIPVDSKMKNRINLHRYGHFVSCWHICEEESDPMWRLYSLSGEGVAIQSTKGIAKDCLRPYNSGDVIYYNPKADVKNDSIFGNPDILYKRHHFESEKEYRLWFDDDEFMTKANDGVIDENTITPGRLVPISDLERFIQRIVVAPAKSDGFAKLVKSVCRAYKLKWLAAKVEQSYIDALHESQLFPDAKR
jgi:Protein of unknown function (DUF2971)